MAPKVNTASTQLGPEDFADRGAYGDKRAATEDKLMTAHAESLYKAGIIGDDMKAQLSQPWHKSGQLNVQYTKEYMAMSPLYTGSNADEMPTYEEALKRQKERDAAQKKFLADFAAGKIDEDGNRIQPRGTVKKPSTDQKKSTISGSKVETASASSDEQQNLADDTTAMSSSTSSSATSSVGDPTSTTAITAATSTGKPKPKRGPRSKPQVTPLNPLPSRPDYSNFDYFELAALCRDRSLPGGGVAQMLRNRLIQDDMDVEMGRERAVKGYKNSGRVYKTIAPVEEKVEEVKEDNAKRKRELEDEG